MAPANRPPSRGRRRPAVAGTRGPGVDRSAGTPTGTDPTTTDERDDTDDTVVVARTAGDTATEDTATGEASTGDTATGEASTDDSTTDLRKSGTGKGPGTRSTPKAKARTSAPRTRTAPAEAAGTRPAAPAAVTTRRARPVVAMLGLAAVLVVAALVVGVLALVRTGQAAGSDAPASNVALIDDAATAEAGAATVTILQTAYSYSYTTIDADLNAAVALMTPEMAAKHRASFDSIRQTITDSRTTTKATVVANGVRLLDGDRAEAIAFVTVAGDNDGTALQTAGYRFTANLLKVDGQWQLSGLAES